MFLVHSVAHKLSEINVKEGFYISHHHFWSIQHSFNNDYSIATNAGIIRAVVITKANTPEASVIDGIEQDIYKRIILKEANLQPTAITHNLSPQSPEISQD